NDGAAGLVITDETGVEGTTLAFKVTMASALTTNITFNYSTTAGSATGGGVDYINLTGTATIPAGSTIKVLNVTTIDDASPESGEYFTMNISNASGGVTIADNQGTGSITDNDGGGPNPNHLDISTPNWVSAGTCSPAFVVTAKNAGNNPAA